MRWDPRSRHQVKPRTYSAAVQAAGTCRAPGAQEVAEKKTESACWPAARRGAMRCGGKGPDACTQRGTTRDEATESEGRGSGGNAGGTDLGPARGSNPV